MRDWRLLCSAHQFILLKTVLQKKLNKSSVIASPKGSSLLFICRYSIGDTSGRFVFITASSEDWPLNLWDHLPQHAQHCAVTASDSTRLTWLWASSVLVGSAHLRSQPRGIQPGISKSSVTVTCLTLPAIQQETKSFHLCPQPVSTKSAHTLSTFFSQKCVHKQLRQNSSTNNTNFSVFSNWQTVTLYRLSLHLKKNAYGKIQLHSSNLKWLKQQPGSEKQPNKILRSIKMNEGVQEPRGALCPTSSMPAACHQCCLGRCCRRHEHM